MKNVREVVSGWLKVQRILANCDAHLNDIDVRTGDVEIEWFTKDEGFERKWLNLPEFEEFIRAAENNPGIVRSLKLFGAVTGGGDGR